MRTGFAAAAAVAALALVPTSAGAAVINPEVVEPQVVTPQVVTPAPDAADSSPTPVEGSADAAASQATETAPTAAVGDVATDAADQATGRSSNAGNPGACKAGIHQACRLEAAPAAASAILGNLFQVVWHHSYSVSAPNTSSSSYWQAIDSVFNEPDEITREVWEAAMERVHGSGGRRWDEDPPKSEE